MRGLQTGSAATPIVVTDAVGPQVRDFINAPPRKRFAIISLPAVVDATTGETVTVRDHLVRGAMYDAHLRRVLRDHVGNADVGPEPSSARRTKRMYGAIALLAGLPILVLLVLFLIARIGSGT